jgi:hypothetical protein
VEYEDHVTKLSVVRIALHSTEHGGAKNWQVSACKHTSWVVAGRQQNTAGSFPYPDDVAGCRCAEDAILTDEQLLDTVGGTNLRNQLSDLRVPVAAVSANDEGRALNALRDGLKDAGDEGF